MARETGSPDGVAVADKSVNQTPLTDSVSTQRTVLPLAVDETHTPDRWAEILFPLRAPGRSNHDYWKHAAASALHGWWLCTEVTGTPIQLTRAQYEHAIAAAESGYRPHLPATFRKDSR